MPAWSQPRDLKTWIRQGLSLGGLIVVLVALAILILELRFNWVEILAGRYLVVTNDHRPQSGSVWDQDRLKQVATQTLERMVSRQLSARREAQEADSLADLAAGLGAGQGAMISTEKFRALYANLPEPVSRRLFSPIFLLRIAAEKSWDRVYLEKENGQLGIYLLDRSNNVLSYGNAGVQQLQPGIAMRPTVEGNLDDHEEFVGRIYPADRFFMALGSLPPETRQGVLLHPNRLLTAEGTPVRVGISDEVHADLIRIGVEVDTPQGKMIHMMTGKELAVWQVRGLLEPRLPDRSHEAFHRRRLKREP